MQLGHLNSSQEKQEHSHVKTDYSERMVQDPGNLHSVYFPMQSYFQHYYLQPIQVQISNVSQLAR